MRRRRPLVLVTAVAVGLATVVGTAPGVQAQPGPAAEPQACAAELFDEPMRAAVAERSEPQRFDRAVERATPGAETALETRTDDPALWVDTCGTPFYVEPERAGTSGAEEAERQGRSSAAALPAGVDVRRLASRPGSSRTIHLDVDGATVTGTAWNRSFEQPTLTVPPFSKDSTVTTSFSAAEQEEIYRMWATVAEDYAPFDVNVTTLDPGDAAITRSSSSDEVYGTRAIVAAGGPIYEKCRCGGVAYVDVFDAVGRHHATHQPAWVFTGGVGTNGWNVGEAISHEVGHNLGLQHDGNASDAYDRGAGVWAPIMGVSYGKAVTQWSRGEYPGANNRQDDLAVIAAGGAPPSADDHGDTTASATPLTSTAPRARGVIGTRADLDVFSVTGAGATTVRVSPDASAANLDVQLRVRDAAGRQVALVNPPSTTSGAARPTPGWMGATWTGTLPDEGSTWTVEVDGVGNGSPSTAGNYSDYASLGRYEVAVTTGSVAAEPDPDPLTTAGDTAQTVTRGRPFSLTPVAVEGGTAPYFFEATGLPPGVTMSDGGVLSGTSSTVGRTTVVVTVVDAAKQRTSRAFTLVTEAAPPGGDPPQPPAVVDVPPQTVAAVAGRPISAQLRATGASGPVDWTAVGALPAGLSLSGTGRLTGRVARAGSYAFEARALTPTEGGDVGRVTVTVRAAMTFATGATLPAGKVRRAYDRSVALTGAPSGTTWRRVSGALPAGLRWSVAGGGTRVRITGRPTRVQTARFAFRATARDGQVVTRTFRLRVTR